VISLELYIADALEYFLEGYTMLAPRILCHSADLITSRLENLSSILKYLARDALIFYCIAEC
jgi:hypothetical protein